MSNDSIYEELHHCRLRPEEINNPYQAISNFFDTESLAEIRETFDEFSETLFTESFGELDSNNKYLHLRFLRRIEALIEGSYIIHKQRQIAHLANQQEERTIRQCLNAAGMSTTEKIIGIIKAITRPEKIFRIPIPFGDRPEAGEPPMHYLVLVSQRISNPEPLLQRIAKVCAGLGTVIVTIRQLAEVNRKLRYGHIFYSVACRRKQCLFDTHQTLLHYPCQQKLYAIITAARASFEKEFKKASPFLLSARWNAEQQEYGLAAGLLHYAIISTLRAAMLALLDYTLPSQDLLYLLQHTNRISPAFTAILLKEETPASSLLPYLQKAWLPAQAGQNIALTPAQLNVLLDRVSELFLVIPSIVEERLTDIQQLLSMPVPAKPVPA